MLLPIADIRNLSRLNALVSLAMLMVDWAIIIGAIALHVYFPNPFVYIFSWSVIGARMYALYSLLHDGIHYLLFPNKKINDWICKIFLAAPLFISLKKMRTFHFAHHHHLQTNADPEKEHLKYREFQFPKSKKDWFIIVAGDVLGINFIVYKLKKFYRILKDSNKRILLTLLPEDRFLLVIYVIAAIAIIYSNSVVPFVIYWLLPYITIYQLLNRLRLSTEHFNLPKESPYKTRTAKLNFFESFIFSPHNLGFHTEHHLYPGVPFYRLPQLHKILMKTEFQDHAIVKTTFNDVMKEFIKK